MGTSGHVIQPGDKFVAAPASIPFGTMIAIPGYGRVPVLDRGGAIIGNKLDVYMENHDLALAWGRQVLTVTIKEHTMLEFEIAETEVAKTNTPRKLGVSVKIDSSGDACMVVHKAGKEQAIVCLTKMGNLYRFCNADSMGFNTEGSENVIKVCY